MVELALPEIESLARSRAKIGAVMVVGGGISGIQASLDLANSGFKVYLVDEAPAIGGKMAQLDKTFPTNDCSMCILSPKLIECRRNPNIEIITKALVDEVRGGAGNFSVTLLKKPKYVDEKKCVGCGECARFCVVKIPDPFNEGLSTAKCIHVPFAQAVPAASVVDPEHCLFLIRRECKACVPVCKNKAIDFNQQEERVEIGVGAIILSPGYERFDPRLKGEYGYGRMKNVITSLEFERMLNSSGPDRGELLRPSDKKPPARIAWIQCVGSRDLTVGNPYCSSVCCMNAIKQVMLAKEHHEGLGAAIFHNDIRAFGKGFEQYYEMAQSLPSVRFVRSMVSSVKEVPQTKNLTLSYSQNEGKVVEEEFDLVVLSVGLMPSRSATELAEKLGFELNPYRFCSTRTFRPGETSRPGIYVSGAFQGPKDIPESVMTAGSAVSLSAQLLSSERGTLVQEKEYLAERDVAGEEPRVGVFVCRCGTNIGRVVDVPGVAAYSETIDGVVHTEENLYSCSIDTASHICEVIKEKRLNRVVVAACTPRTHELVFQNSLREAGLNPYLFEMANIREHCSWVHAREREKASGKAEDLVRMAVTKARLLQPLPQLSSPVTRAGLIIGGGISGMVSTLTLAEQGFEVYLVEKAENLGGTARRIRYTLGGDDVQAYLEDLITRIDQHPLIHTYTSAEIIKVSGSVGNFSTSVRLEPTGEVVEIKHGIIIIASGGQEYKPQEYYYQEDPRVLTLLELEQRIADGDPKVTGSHNVVFIQCVGSRDSERPYCSRVCCSHSLKCALKLKEINPGMNIYVLYRDLRSYGFMEDYYRKAREKGVNFIRYEPEHKPEVEITEAGALQVVVTDLILGRRLVIAADILTLAAATIPAGDNKKLSRLFKVPQNRDGFFLEAHMKLRPVDFASDGIFMCGLAHSPKLIEESISQAQAAATRAATILSKPEIEAAGTIGYVDWDKCIGCKICQSLCPFEAIELKETEQGVKAQIIPASCKSCGLCSVRCPVRAITMGYFSDEEISAQIAALAVS